MKRSFQEYLARAASGTPLDASQMRAAMELILSGGVGDIQTAGFLLALRTRGETIEEITAAAQVMREKAIRISAPEDAIDTCGTGGDGAGTYNISTAAAIVAAGAGVSVAKHGNRAASSNSGSSDILAELGVNLQAGQSQLERSLAEARLAFLFAAAHHKAVAHVASVRKALGVRTIFNLLGPLTNPAGAKRQLMGVFSETLLDPLAKVLDSLGATRAWVVHGEDGLDELTTTGVSKIASLSGGKIERLEVSPEDAGLQRTSLDRLKGGDPAHNAAALRALLDGERGPYRDIVLLNAGAALIVAGQCDTIREGADRAARSIDSGAAKSALADLVRYSNEPAP